MSVCHHDRVTPPTEPPEYLPGGSGGVWRVGRTVRRPSGPWSPAVHELLDWLAAEGLGGIPHVTGVDDDGREIVSYIEGRSVPVDDEVVLDQVLVEAVGWLRDFHDIVEGFPAAPRIWRQSGDAPVEPAPGQIICHNDPGAYNWIVQSGHFAAMIDWDLAGPGERLDDLAFLCWSAVPLFREIPAADVIRRIDLVAEAYGEWGPRTILEAVERRMTTACDRIDAGIRRADPGMVSLAAAGEPERTRRRLDDFRSRLPTILVP